LLQSAVGASFMVLGSRGWPYYLSAHALVIGSAIEIVFVDSIHGDSNPMVVVALARVSKVFIVVLV